MEAGIVRSMDAERAAFSIWSFFYRLQPIVRLPNLSAEEIENMFETQKSLERNYES